MKTQAMINTGKRENTCHMRPWF